MTRIRLPIDVSGNEGAPGTPGQHGEDRIKSRSGGNGSRGHRGISAGTISVRLTAPKATAKLPTNQILANPIDVDVKLDGDITKANGQWQEVDHSVLRLNSGESMSFLAVGGDGGRGGNGGDGQNGVSGSRYGAFLLLSMNPFLNMLGEQGNGCNYKVEGW
jgi:hypothetical protein